MGAFDMDWDAVLKDASDNNTQAAIPPDDYEVEIIKAEATTYGTGSTGIKCVHKVLSGPHEDRWLWNNLVFKEGQARQISVRNLLAMGVDRDWLQSSNPSLDQVADRIVGLRAIAVVGQKQYQGETRNEIKAYKKLDGQPGVPTAAPGPSATPAATATPTQPAPTPPTPAASDGEPQRPF